MGENKLKTKVHQINQWFIITLQYVGILIFDIGHGDLTVIVHTCVWYS
jgi:hypothetical protein